MEYPSYLVHFNPNHDPKSGRFTTGNGSSVTSKVGARLKKNDLLNLDGPTAWRDFDNKTGNYSRLKAAADTGMKAMARCGDSEPLDEDWGDWFLFEDQTFGMPQIADLANKGKTKEEIKQIIKDSVEFMRDDPYSDRIPGAWALSEWDSSNQYYTVDGDKYIDACIEAAKENKQVKHSGITQFGNYICHFNQNHSPKNGQFTFGDGDGDGASDERGRRGRYKPEVIGNGSQYQTQYVPKILVKGAVKFGKWAAGKAFAMTKWGKQYNQIKKDWIDVGRYTLANTDLRKSLEAANIGGLKVQKDQFVEGLYDKATDSINRKINKYVEG